MATSYIVLRQAISEDGRTATFTLANNSTEGTEALNADQACKIVAEGLKDSELEEGVTLVAVPARSWKYVNLKAEMQRRLKVSS